MLFKVKDTVTLGNLFCGFLAIVLILEGRLFAGSLLILLATVFDFSDGFIARRFFEGTDFGAELDSISDVVSFGVAPALLVYRGVFQNYLGVFVSMVILCMATFRLARFNLIGGDDPKIFVGLPVPASAILVVVYYNVGLAVPYYYHALFFVLVALLNASSFRYPSQKQHVRGIAKKSLLFLAVAIGAYLAVFQEGLLWYYLLVISVGYMVSPVGLWLLRKR